VPVSHDRSNNFDAIRLLGAILVLVGHAYPLHSVPGNPGVFGFSIETLGLILFFSLSGFLITVSWHGDPRLLAYLGKRSLRIFPALIVVVLLSMFVLGPTLSQLSVAGYFADSTLWAYLKNVVLFPAYGLPGVFQSIPYPGAVNGSLWSLPPEFACYLMVPIVAFLPLVARSIAFLVLGMASGIASSLLSTNGVHIVIWGTDLSQATSVWPFFLVGAGIALARTWLPLRVDFGFIAITLGAIVASVSPALGTYLWWFVLPYAIIAFGSTRTPVVSRVGRFGDFSYGMYLYAFPVQQSVIFLAPQLSFRVSVAATLAITFVLAVASWHLVEKPALILKPRSARPQLSGAGVAVSERAAA
jgi:peptidoglycan/LPS O-acetylase OafA/YrhL